MLAHFESKSGELGLDDDHQPHATFVVRTNSKRRLFVRGNPGVWKVDSDDDTVLKARVLSSLGTAGELELHGLESGTAMLHAHHGRMSARLHVHVVEPREMSVNFHFFTSGPSRTDLTRADGVKLLENVNKIYEPQTYLKFRIHRMDAIQDQNLLDLDFGSKDQEDDAEDTIWETLRDYLNAKYPMRSQRNVFVVRKWGLRDRQKCSKTCESVKVLGTNPIGGNICILQYKFADSTKLLPQVLAHELGHSLGLRHDPHHADNLMQPYVDASHVKIDHEQLRKIDERY